MTFKPISIPIRLLATVLLSSSAFAGGGPFPDGPAPRLEQPKAASTDPAPCEQGQAYTCKLQCSVTTRTFWERWVNNAGVETCVNLGCACEQQVVQLNVNDPTQPIALVIFGVRQMLPQLPQ